MLLPLVSAWTGAALALVTRKSKVGQPCWPESVFLLLLQAVNALFLRGLPGSQELNQQLATHFIAKVKHFMHTQQLLLGHISYL